MIHIVTRNDSEPYRIEFDTMEHIAMKAARLQEYGDVNQFRLEEALDPTPQAGEVVIAVAASGLNPVDLYLRQGYLKEFMPIELPGILGIDAAGTITAVGEGVTGFAVGDRVVGHLPINGRGAHAQKAVVPVAGLAKLPASLSFEAGATLPVAGLTARDAVDSLGAMPGQRVLVVGALGAVGRAAVQYLKEIGATPVAGVRAARLSEGKALAGEAIDVETAVGAQFDHAVSAAPAVAGKVPALVKDGGTVASVVQTPPEANPGERVKVAQIMTQDNPAKLAAVVDAAARGELVIPIARTFPLAELGAAHGALAEAPHGKIVLTH
jgi:NADPH:quinone reductase-like Zn-dependent oxidoreductase